MAAVSFNDRTKAKSVSDNGLTINNKSFQKKEIFSLDYSEPKGLFGALFFNLRYVTFGLGIIGIPKYIYEITRSKKYWLVTVTLKNEFEKNGERKLKKYYMTAEEVSKIKGAY